MGAGPIPLATAADLARLGADVRAGIPHYWIVDPDHATLTVLRWTPDGYLTALTAGKADTMRAEPFGEIELRVGVLFGEEKD